MNKILKLFISVLMSKKQEEAEDQPEPARPEPEFDWQYLVTPGHTIFARMNHLSFVGVRLLILLLVTIGLFYYSFMSAKNLLTQLEWTPDNNDRQMIDANKIIEKSRRFQLAAGSTVTNAADLRTFITDNLQSLAAENKLGYPCIQSSKIAAAWADKYGSIDYPLCNPQPAGQGKPKRIYVYGIVNDGGQLKNWVGVFYQDKIWHYRNLGLTSFYKVPKYAQFDSQLIVNTLLQDFSDLPISRRNTDE